MAITFKKKPVQPIAQDCLSALKEKAAGKEQALLLVKTLTNTPYHVMKIDFDTPSGWPRLLLQAEERVIFWTQFGERENEKYFPVWR